MEQFNTEKVQRVTAICGRIAPHLAGEGADVQGAVLADLLASLLAGCPNFLREDILHLHIEAVRRLVSVNERLLFKGGEHPQNRHES